MGPVDARYRLSLAEGFLKEAEAAREHELHRAAVDAAQLSVENSAKAVVALCRPVPRIHELSGVVDALMSEDEFDDSERQSLARLRELAEMLGFETHVRTDYGDELQGVTPWDLYDEAEARKAITYASEALRIASGLVERRLG